MNVECEFVRETEILGGNLLQCHFVHHESHMSCPGPELWPPPWETSDYPPEPLPSSKLESLTCSELYHLPSSYLEDITSSEVESLPSSELKYLCSSEKPSHPSIRLPTLVYPSVSYERRKYYSRDLSTL